VRAEQDVRRPRGAGEQREAGSGGGDVPGLHAQDQDADRGQADPQQVAQPAGAENGKGERSDELDGHGDAERDPGEGLVDGPVHDAERDAETDDHPPVRGGPAAQRRAGERAEHDRAGDEPQPHHARRRDLVEQVLRDRGTELDGENSEQHQPDR
jgi:hypothetical protein